MKSRKNLLKDIKQVKEKINKIFKKENEEINCTKCCQEIRRKCMEKVYRKDQKK